MKKELIQLSLRMFGFGGASFEDNPSSDIDDYRPYLKVHHPNGDIIMCYDSEFSLFTWFRYYLPNLIKNK